MLTAYKLEVGQVWRWHDVDPADDIVYVITRIDERKAYHLNSVGSESTFAYIDRDGISHLDEMWALVVQTKIVPALHQQDAMDFFKSVPSGHCPCNIPRSQCDFHK